MTYVYREETGETVPTLHVIIGSTRPGRLGHKVGAWFHKVASADGRFAVELIDLAKINLPLLDEAENPARGGTYAHDHTKAWSALVNRGDAYVFVLGEYNNSFNAATKNAIDYLFHEWGDKAVGMVSYGGNIGAGTRAVQALKPVFLSLNALPVHASVNIPFVHSQLDAGGQFIGDAFEKSAHAMLGEIARRETALRTLRAPTPAVTPTADAASR